ncbi:MAG: hypothetical protein KDD40_12495 [Bdellovibrionales bacterium]|nr:hypothetical protein [Bdellovibrionales bacterium]
MSSIKYLVLLFISYFLVHCSNNVDGTLFQSLTKENCLDDGESACFQNNKDNLNLGSVVRTIYLKPNQTVFNVGGECNEGGFPMNRIDWHVIEESSKSVVVNSFGSLQPSAQAICGNPSALGQGPTGSVDGVNTYGNCVNGRFNMRIVLPKSISYSHDLFLCIAGGNDGKYQIGGTSLNINLEPLTGL